MSCPNQAQKNPKHLSSPVNSDSARNLKALKGDLSEVWFKSLQVFLAEQLLPCEEWSHYWTCSTCSLQRRQSETTCSVWGLEGALAWCFYKTWTSRRRKQRGEGGKGGKGMGKNRDCLLGNVKDGRAEVRGVVWKRKEKKEERNTLKKKKGWKGCKLSATLGTIQLWRGHSKDRNLIQPMPAEQCHREGRISLFPTQLTPLCCEICKAIKTN